MKSRIDKIKRKAIQINKDTLIKKGKDIFGKEHFAEFTDCTGPGYILDETYTCYSSENKLVLECLMKYCNTKEPDDLTITDSDFTTSRDMIYIKGEQITEISMKNGIEDKMQEYKEALQVIEDANQREKMQKQHIRNFFRKIFARNNSNLLNGDITKLSKQEITKMLDSIQEKPKNFIENYNKTKTKTDKIIDFMQGENKSDRKQEQKENDDRT